MARIDFLIFGYRKISVDKKDVGVATSILLRNSIISHTKNDGSVLIRERDVKIVGELFDGKIEYEISELLGLYGKYKAVPHKLAVAFALLISVSLIILSSDIVWDVRMEDNTDASEHFVECALDEIGFGIGSLWHKCDLSKLETEFLLSNPEFAWININRRGSVAYITVSKNENAEHEDKKENLGYSNIVAAVDCVIEEIRVTRGRAMVKKGDTVKAGDILISGVVSGDDLGELCYAEGEVIGRMADTVTVFVDRNYEKAVSYDETLIECEIKIFDFPINIFKRYRKNESKCDIIEDVKVFSIFGKRLLPIKMVSKYERIESTVSMSYSDAEIVKVAAARLNSATLARIVNADLIKIRTSGEFSDDGYTMSSRIEFLGSVGKSLPFKAE